MDSQIWVYSVIWFLGDSGTEQLATSHCLNQWWQSLVYSCEWDFLLSPFRDFWGRSGVQKCLFFTKPLLYPPTTKLLGGISVSLRPSVRPSVRPASRVRSVAPAVLVGSISYLYILSSNFRRCVVCKVLCKILKFEFLAIFQNL